MRYEDSPVAEDRLPFRSCSVRSYSSRLFASANVDAKSLDLVSAGMTCSRKKIVISDRSVLSSLISWSLSTICW